MAYIVKDEQDRPVIYRGSNVMGSDSFEDVECLDFNDKDHSFLAVGSQESPDRFRDVIQVDGWELKNYRKNPVVLFAHNYSNPPIGRSLEEFSDVKKNVKRLMIRPQFHTLTEDARTLYSLYKEKYIRGFSVGFLPKKSEEIKQDDKKKDDDEHHFFHRPTLFKKQELLENSSVPLPAHPDALSEIKTMVKNGSLYIPARYLQEEQTPEVETYDEYIHVKVEDEGRFKMLYEDEVDENVVRVFGSVDGEFMDHKFIFARKHYTEEEALEAAGAHDEEYPDSDLKEHDLEAYSARETVLIDAFPVLDDKAFAAKGKREELDTAKSLKDQFSKVLNRGTLDDYEYLLHHIETDENGKEVIHHCFVYDHLGNLFQQKHITIKNGKVFFGRKEVKEGTYHVVGGLEPTQEVSWSDEEAKEHKITPKKMKAGMTYKEKAKEW